MNDEGGRRRKKEEEGGGRRTKDQINNMNKLQSPGSGYEGAGGG